MSRQASAGRPAAVPGVAGEEDEHVGATESSGGAENRGDQQSGPGHLQPGSEEQDDKGRTVEKEQLLSDYFLLHLSGWLTFNLNDI